MSRFTQPRKPIAPKRDAKAELTAFLAERKRAYAESVFVALCQNPNVVNDDTLPKEVAAKADAFADALLDVVFVKPLEKAAKENKTK